MDNNKKQQNYTGAANTKSSNQTSDSNRQKSSSSDIQSNKNWPKESRRRENPATSARNNNNNSKQRSAKVRPNVDKRPRGRGYNNNNNGYNAGSSYRRADEDYSATSSGLESRDASFCEPLLEAGRYAHTDYDNDSFFALGGKKQNLNHLLNFYYTPREVDYYDGGKGGSNGGNQRHVHTKKPKYDKEQFLQANFQFVIKASAKPKTDYSPDTLIDWSLIEQINIQTPDEPQCPICLYPPIAAKVTRCGHVYCWPCVLHYLSLSDKAWRKCPICYDAIYLGDLKSASIVQQQRFNVNSNITFQLMRRKKGSLLIEKYDNRKKDDTIEKYPYLNSPMEEKLFSKFILARRNDVANILAREERELLLVGDKSCPEYIFIQQALELLKQRTEKLGNIEQTVEEKIYFEENVENSTIIDDVNIVQTPQVSYNDINDSEELVHDMSPIGNESKNFEDSSESSSNPETVSSTQSSFGKKSSIKFYYFYQADDGQNIYLHPLNVKMLQASYGSLANAPPVISARIIQKEQHSMDEDHRRKFTCLGHLPLTCQFAVVEIELQQPYVTADIIEAFKADILYRKKERQRKAIEERKREKHINAINERQMGKIIASTASINITSPEEFPMCGFEEPLVSPNDSDLLDNVPSTSKACRTKTVSTSSTGSCSYSAIAIHCKKEHTPWSTLNAAQIKPSPTSTIGDKSAVEGGDTSILNTIHTNLGDVLAQALSEKKERKSIKADEITVTSNKKKSKKPKKMLPLYSTGMNFSGN